jgi:pimeloyl-ACP methyl ester carboxylesterase
MVSRRGAIMTDLFSAYEVRAAGTKIHAYLIESTAPENIDDTVKAQDVPQYTEQINADDAIEKITNDLKNSDNPTLVVSIHGFNNPRDIIFDGYWNSFNSLNEDNAVNNRDVVCIGYRWPSERIGATFTNSFKAAPNFLKYLFLIGIAIILAVLIMHCIGRLEHLLTIIILWVGVLLMSIPATFFLLRIIVYFRDGYRATAFGVPDLVEIIRQIDKKLAKKDERRNQVRLSFIGHSMGAYVVTNVVRILSDVFSPASIRAGLNARPDHTPASVSSNIGKVFRLKRLVLVSPDIPAEALISSRANFLSASLLRFEEAFLFSNEGDEVLRQISTTANYFSFPTKSNKFGYRLGNVCLLDIPSGITKGINLQRLQIGKLTLAEIYKNMEKIGFGQLQDDLPKRFSYFDCTDCVENGKGMLTRAKPGRIKKIGHLGHLSLLVHYLWNRKPDVHGGYFRSRFLSTLIFRLACIGRHDTVQAYGGEAQLDAECRQRQIKALLNS